MFYKFGKMKKKKNILLVVFRLFYAMAEKIAIDQAVWSSTVAWLSGWCLNYEKGMGGFEHFLTVLMTELKTEDSIQIPAD